MIITIKDSIKCACQLLADNHIDDAPLEGELLIRQVLGLSRVQLYLSLEDELDQQQEEDFQALLDRRLSGEPTAYITGHREFYGFDFIVSPGVLIPRPETELMVEKAINLAQKYEAPVIADIGTGCGAIAITLALNLPRAKLYATDISPEALEIARLNSQQHGVTDRIVLLKGDMLEPLPEPVDLIVANLPYVKRTEIAADSYEPALALNGGADGTAKIQRLCHQAKVWLCPSGSLLLEIGQGQGAVITFILSRLYPQARIETIPDLSGIDRVVSLVLP